MYFKPLDFKAQFPNGANPMASMFGGILAGEIETRRTRLQQVPEKVMMLNPGMYTKRVGVMKKRCFLGKGYLTHFSKLPESEIESFSMLWRPEGLPPLPVGAQPAPPLDEDVNGNTSDDDDDDDDEGEDQDQDQDQDQEGGE
jgi:hypothetical protein